MELSKTTKVPLLSIHIGNFISSQKSPQKNSEVNSRTAKSSKEKRILPSLQKHQKFTPKTLCKNTRKEAKRKNLNPLHEVPNKSKHEQKEQGLIPSQCFILSNINQINTAAEKKTKEKN